MNSGKPSPAMRQTLTAPAARWLMQPGTVLGLLACAFFAVHAACQWWAGTSENLLWACHAADLFVGIGLLVRSRTVTAAGVLMLAIGVPLWLINLAYGGAFYPTSMLTHFGGLAVGIAGMHCLGVPERAWLTALGLTAVLLVASRVLTSPAANVNLVYQAWQQFWPDLHAPEWHILALLALWMALLWSVERSLRWLKVFPSQRAS